MKITCELDTKTLNMLRRGYAKADKALANAARRAANRTATGTRTEISKRVRERVPIAASVVKKATTIKQATNSNPTALVDTEGKRLPLIAFKARQTSKGVTYDKGDGKERHNRAFIETMPLNFSGSRILALDAEGGNIGHKGVFVRIWTFENSRKFGSKKSDRAWGRIPKEYTRKGGEIVMFRHPIKELGGPAVAEILGGNTLKKVMEYTQDRLDRELNHEIEYELSKMGKSA